MNKKINFKFLDIITGFFVAILLISGIADTKVIALGPISFGGGTILFPIAYIFGDVLTEVYGFKRARRVIWIGFISEALMAITFILVGLAPYPKDWNYQKDYMNILGLTPRIVIASLTAYFIGEFANSIILAKMKILTKGKYLWTRTIGSTIVGELFDSMIFVSVAFLGIFPLNLIFTIIISEYLLKVLVEIILTPVTYKVVNFLKKKEHEDYFDRKTYFTLFEFSSD
jgi:queuosine precursor transporter